MPIQSIGKQNISEKVFEQIKGLIISGEWKPGEKIPSEIQLAEIMNVSRVSIRSALQKFGSLGIITRQQGKGTIICDFSGQQQLNGLVPVLILNAPDLNSMSEYRIVFECGAVELAATRCKEHFLTKLSENLDQMTTLINEGQDSAEVDVGFHCLIGDATENPLIVRTFQIMKSAFLDSMREYKKLTEIHTGLYYHKKLLEALAHHDSYSARRIMEEHLESNKINANLQKL